MVKEGAFLWVSEAVNGVYFWGRVKRENGWVLIFISFIPLPTISPNQPALCPDRLGHPSWDVQQAFGGGVPGAQGGRSGRCGMLGGTTAGAWRAQQT